MEKLDVTDLHLDHSSGLPHMKNTSTFSLVIVQILRAKVDCDCIVKVFELNAGEIYAKTIAKLFALTAKPYHLNCCFRSGDLNQIVFWRWLFFIFNHLKLC